MIFLKFQSKLRQIFHSLSSSHIPVYSAAICYYLFLASIQMAWLFLYVVSRLPLASESWEQLFALFIPKVFYPLIKTLLDTAQNRHPVLMPFAVLTTVWSSSKAVSGLLDGLNCGNRQFITGIGMKKRILASIYYIFLNIVLLAGLTISLLGRRILHFIPDLLPLFEHQWFHYTWSFLILCIFVAMIYYYLSKEQLPFYCCVISGIIVVLGWSFLTISFSLLYRRMIQKYDLGLLVLFGLWLYDCLLLLLYGRLGAKILYELKY